MIPFASSSGGKPNASANHSASAHLFKIPSKEKSKLYRLDVPNRSKKEEEATNRPGGTTADNRNGKRKRSPLSTGVALARGPARGSRARRSESGENGGGAIAMLGWAAFLARGGRRRRRRVNASLSAERERETERQVVVRRSRQGVINWKFKNKRGGKFKFFVSWKLPFCCNNIQITIKLKLIQTYWSCILNCKIIQGKNGSFRPFL